MKKWMMTMAVMTLMMMTMMGCSFPSLSADGANFGTMNQQRSALRGASDLATTAAIDLAGLDAETVTAIGTVAEQVDAFLQSGTVSALVGSEIKIKLVAMIPAKYQAYFSTLLSVVSGQSVDLSTVLSTNAVKRLRAALHGVKTACAEYEPED